MKLSVLLLMFWLLSVHVVQAQNEEIFPRRVHKILFLGNSITYDGKYIVDLEAYFIARYPKRHFEFINVGLPSEAVSGLSEPNHADGKFPRPDLHERLGRVAACGCKGRGWDHSPDAAGI